MYSLNELKKQNQDINDLIEVLRVLINNENLMSNPFVCDLVSRFNEKVWMHLIFEEKSVYAELAKHPEQSISQTAQEFHDSAKAIKKEFSQHVKLWCKVSGADHHHQAFCSSSADMLNKIQQRLDFERNKIFPLIEA